MAEGKVELGLIVIPNIMSVPGAELVGPLPEEINSIVMFTAGVSAHSPNQQAARGIDQAAEESRGQADDQGQGQRSGINVWLAVASDPLQCR